MVVLVIPVPDHVPPSVSTVRLKGGELMHIGGTAVISGLFPKLGVTSTTNVKLTGPTHAEIGVPETVYVVVVDLLSVIIPL